MEFILTCLEQILPFLPLAYAISISFNVLQVTDLALDASFIAGAGCYAKLVLLGFNPISAALFALLAGGLSGVLTALIQHRSRINSLLASVLSSFILYSVILVVMNRPNISLLGVSSIFDVFHFKNNNMILHQDLLAVAIYVTIAFLIAYMIVSYSRIGLLIAAFGSNFSLLKRLGYKVELIRVSGFIITNMLAALSGILTCCSVGYADINMSIGLTLIGIGTVIIGQSILSQIYKKYYFRFLIQLISCILGVSLYFIVLNLLLQHGVDPVYIKMLVGMILVFFIYLSSSFQGVRK